MKLKRRFWRQKSAPLSCRELGHVLQGYLDGQLAGADATLVAAHLDECLDCGLEAGAYERIKAALADPMPEGADPDAIERLRQFGRDLSAGD